MDFVISFCNSSNVYPIASFAATLAIGKAGAKNSALFAIAILSRKYPKISQKLKKYRSEFESNIPKRPY